MARPILALVVVLTLLLGGCGEGGDEAGSIVPCDDVAFRAQDEELYVTQATVSNAMGGSGDAATLLLDLRRARAALAGHLDARPPCDEALADIAKTERDAIGDLDEAIAALDESGEAGPQLASALAALEEAQRELSDAP